MAKKTGKKDSVKIDDPVYDKIHEYLSSDDTITVIEKSSPIEAEETVPETIVKINDNIPETVVIKIVEENVDTEPKSITLDKNIEVETEIPALDTTKMNRYDYRNYIRTGILPTPYPKG